MVLNIRHSVLTAPLGGGGAGLPSPPAAAGVTGAARTTYTGSSTITTANVTVQHKNISGQINVRANNVTFYDCLFNTSNDTFGIDADGATGARSGLTVDHCTIISSTRDGNSGVLTGDNWEVTNCEIYGWENGIYCQEGTGLADGNYIHDLGSAGDAGTAHVDGIQVPGACDGVVIQNNWIEGWDTSAIIIKADGGNINNVTVQGNTMRCDPGHPSSPYSACIYSYSVGGRTATNIHILNNRMEEGNGYLATQASTPTTSGNVDYFTGALIEPL